MREARSWLAVTPAILLILALLACGGNANPSPMTPTTPTTSGGGTPAPATASPSHYEASLINGTVTGSTKVGTIVVDNGKVTYQFSGWVAHQIYRVDFCQYPVFTANACIAVDPGGTADANGAGQGSFQFPHSGTWHGWFRFSQSGSNPILASGWVPSSSGGTVYNAAFLLANSFDRIQSGSASVTNGTIHVQITGARANTVYQVWEGFAGAGEDQAGTLTTDANGNATGDFASEAPNGLVLLRSDAGDGLETGFAVP